ncbi:MAG: hypothetical protein FJ395_08300 [Verrucomicrobia bacterium]|nr:hypothetical protein [Verrucomicrobiota bacterium]
MSKTMLLWQPNVKYESTLTLSFEANNVEILGDASGKPISGVGSRPLFYSGKLKYTTDMHRGNRDQGSAIRRYEVAEMSKVVGDTYVTISGFPLRERLWHIFRKYAGEGSDYDMVQSRITKDFIVVRPKKNEFAKMVDEVAPMFETIPKLKGQTFILSWSSDTQARNAALKVAMADSNYEPSQTEQPPEIVSDVIRREASLLYNAALGDRDRKAGDTWVMDGTVLGGLIYPTLKSAFTGQAVVRAEEFKQATPPLDRYPNSGTTASPDSFAHKPFNGIRVVFTPSGPIEGQRIISKLRYRTETADGGQREIGIDFGDPSKVVGDMYVDTDRQMIRHAYLKVTDAEYTGSIPKFGSVTVNARVKGGIVLLLQYDCVPVSYQP